MDEHADRWLVAYAKEHGYIVVTEERFEPENRKKVKIPNLCHEFSVEWCDTFTLLRRLGVFFVRPEYES